MSGRAQASHDCHLACLIVLNLFNWQLMHELVGHSVTEEITSRVNKL